MNSIAQFSQKAIRGIYSFCFISRSLCSSRNGLDDEFLRIERYLNRSWKRSNREILLDENLTNEEEDESVDSVGVSGRYGEYDDYQQNLFTRASFLENAKMDASRALEVLQQDGPGFDAKAALDDLQIRISGLLVREVLAGILTNINYGNRSRSARLGYKFFVWSGQKDNNSHTVNTYHLIMKIFAESEEYKAMWRLVDEMIEKGYPVTSRTFNILICASARAGLTKEVVERFIKSKKFNFRPLKNTFNAVLHSLLVVKQYKLIEWVYQQMLDDGHLPDVLTYNILLYTKCRLGKTEEFRRLLDEMCRRGFHPDVHTFNIFFHIHGKSDKPAAAVNLLNDMKEFGVQPSVLHFTTLIDGLSRAGNMDACKYFFNEMIKQGCVPDVVSYTVMITGHIAVGQLKNAEEIFSKMIVNGQIPNVYTYNSMIRGLCMAGRFKDACLMLKEMESRGINPNFLVYSTLVRNLRNAGKLSEAHKVIEKMVEKGQYVHLLPKIWGYRGC